MAFDGSVLVLNCGSSSLKYQLVRPDTGEVLARGSVERIGESTASIVHRDLVGDTEVSTEEAVASHGDALAIVADLFAEVGPNLFDARLRAYGHRVVHGGEAFSGPVLVDDDVLDEIDDLASLAPLHNPPAAVGIRAAQKVRPEVPHVAVFDTAFFAGLPAASRTYAIDTEVAARHGIRRYGFHGTSHDWVSARTADLLGRSRSELKQIVLHLGNGASASAIDGDAPLDTSMGLTPLEGLVMGTRSGDVDPGVVAHLARDAGMSIGEIDTLLNKRSGLLGLSGVNDFRELTRLRADGDPAAEVAYEVLLHRLLRYVGGYLAVLGGLDVLTFTAGIGENAPHLRADLADRLSHLGFAVDPVRNEGTGARVISPDHSPVTICVTPTNEELAIARQVADLLG